MGLYWYALVWHWGTLECTGVALRCISMALRDTGMH